MSGTMSATGYPDGQSPPAPGPVPGTIGTLLAVLLFAVAAPPTSEAAVPELLHLARGPVTVLHHPGDESIAVSIARLGEDLHRQIRQDLDLRSVVPVTVYLLRDEYYEGEGGESLPAPWIAGTANASRRSIVLRLYPGKSSFDYAGTMAHELTHVILEEDYPGQSSWPLWFREGLAMRQSGKEGLRHGTALFLSSFRRGLIPLDALQHRFPAGETSARLAYAQSYSVIAYLHSRYGRGRFEAFLRELRARSFPEAFSRVYGIDLILLEDEWRRYVKRRYSWIPLVTGASTFWFLCVAVFFLSLLARRRKTLAIRERWEEEESG